MRPSYAGRPHDFDNRMQNWMEIGLNQKPFIRTGLWIINDPMWASTPKMYI